MYLLFCAPTKQSFLYSLASCAFAFYFFGGHVHEKTVLVPLLPITALILNHPTLNLWLNLVGCFR